MTPLFSKKALTSLKKQLQHKNVFGFDLDGTLIPIRRNFEKVRIPNRTKFLLENLANESKVAVISGRSLKDLRRILKPVSNLKEITLIGNHGLEGLGPPIKNEMVKLWKKDLVKKVGGLPGVVLEDKKFSITVHYRLAKNRSFSRIKILQTIKEFKITPRVVLGEFVVNLLPDIGMNKGTAFLKFMNQNNVKYGFYIGDDWTDEDVFCINSKKIFKVRVKPSKKSSAKFYVSKQAGINRILSSLVHGM